MKTDTNKETEAGGGHRRGNKGIAERVGRRSGRDKRLDTRPGEGAAAANCVKTRRGDPYCIPYRMLAALDQLRTKRNRRPRLAISPPPSSSPSEPLVSSSLSPLSAAEWLSFLMVVVVVGTRGGVLVKANAPVKRNVQNAHGLAGPIATRAALRQVPDCPPWPREPGSSSIRRASLPWWRWSRSRTASCVCSPAERSLTP